MRIVKLAIIVALLAGSAAAQVSSSASAADAPDMTVVKISWYSVWRNPKIDPSHFYETGMPREMRPRWGCYYEFTVRNTGSKIIRKIVFEHSFTDTATQKTVGRRQFKSKVKILPGMTATLVAFYPGGPVGTIDVNQVRQDSRELPPEQMTIQKITYADGSVWERASKQPSASRR
ncbi:MAG TPA: hypothetical protein VJS44_00870 [Pyrinomonadaceae bacterium]|nr:hypothetical protein [Pyrinomonadaceae bacterium]